MVMANGAAARPAVEQEERGFVDCGPLRLDLLGYRLRRDALSQGLTLTEARLLEALLSEPNRIFSRSELELLLPCQGAGHRALTAAMSRLRRPLAALGFGNALRAVRGQGYTFVLPSGERR